MESTNYHLCINQFRIKVGIKRTFTFKSQNYLQYFDNMRYSSAASDTFAEVMKVKKHIKLWDAGLTWYSPSVTHRICIWFGSRPRSPQFLTKLTLPDLWDFCNSSEISWPVLITVQSSTSPLSYSGCFSGVMD